MSDREQKETAEKGHRDGLAWRILLPAVALAAGILFSTSAQTSDGTDLRAGRRLQLEQLINARADQVASAESKAARLRGDIDRATRDRARTDARLAGPQRDIGDAKDPVGLRPVRGPAVTVRMSDAPRADDGSLPEGASVDDVVVHQQDVQAVVNALWTGGAEAMTIMDERIIATSAVRCVGNTLLLHGRTFSPPFVITAIGDRNRLRRALDESPDVRLFQEAANSYGLEYRVTESDEVRLPAYTGSTNLEHTTRMSP